MSSRMKSLSSEASKTQLARRVARTSRVNSATPPPTDTNESNEIAEIVKPVPVDPTRGAVAKAGVTPKTNGEGAEPTAVITQRMRETRVDTEEAFMRSIRSIYGNVDRDLPSRRSGSPASSVPRKSTEAQSATSQAQQSSRRLDEAFKSPSPSPSARYEGRRTPSPVPSRKDQIGALRRSSAVSPQPGPTSGPRKSINRDSSSTPVKNGRKTPTAETTGDAPPGFESRSSTMSRGAFLGRGKGDGDVGSVSKTSERERDPVLPRPANSRADAFRQAINTRRHSNSPRSASSRHATTPDSNGDDSSSGRLSLGREESRLRTSDKESSRQGSSASKQTMGVAGTPTHDRDRSRKKPDKVTLQKREERIMRRRFEMAAEVPEAVTVGVDSGSVTTTLEELPLKTNRTDSTKNLSAARNGQAEDKGFNMGGTDTQFSPLTSSKNRFVFAGSPNSSQVQLPEVPHPESVKPTEHSIAQTNLEPAEITTWVNGTTEVSDGDAEAIVNNLLENEDDYLPASSLSTVVGSTPRGKGPSMIDLMQGIHANEPSSSVLSTSDRQEDVLPPLPNSEEDVRFETMLRSMGWTPPEEDETIRNQRNGITVQSNHDPSRSNSSLSGIVGMRPTENGEMQSGYYSHFQ